MISRPCERCWRRSWSCCIWRWAGGPGRVCVRGWAFGTTCRSYRSSRWPWQNEPPVLCWGMSGVTRGTVTQLIPEQSAIYHRDRTVSIKIQWECCFLLEFVDGTYQWEGLCRGQTVDSNLLEAVDDAGAGHGFTLSHPEHPLISQHQVTRHAHHHLTQLGDKFWTWVNKHSWRNSWHRLRKLVNMASVSQQQTALNACSREILDS